MSNLAAYGKISHQLIRNAAVKAQRERDQKTEARRCRNLLPQKRAVFRHDSTVRD
jgi:hypothetical protein